MLTRCRIPAGITIGAIATLRLPTGFGGGIEGAHWNLSAVSVQAALDKQAYFHVILGLEKINRVQGGNYRMALGNVKSKITALVGRPQFWLVVLLLWVLG